MKTFATIAMVAALASSGFAQGFVNYQNALTSQFFFNSTGSFGNHVTSGTIASQPAAGSSSTGVVDVGLFWSTAVFTDPAQGTLADVVTMSATAGDIAGNGDLAVIGANPGDVDYFQVFAWDSAFGNSDAGLQACIAAGGYFGAATAGQGNTIYGTIGAPQQVTLAAGPPNVSTVIFGTFPGAFGRTVLLASPEPPTLALTGMGGTALLVFCRRK